MSVRKGLLVALALVFPLSGAVPVPSARAAQEDSTLDDAYTVWLCPMHRDHQAHGEGNCPLCGMALVRRTLVTRYVCLAQEDGVVEEEPGICPDTGDPLVPATREVVWFCPSDPDRDLRGTRCLRRRRPPGDDDAGLRTRRPQPASRRSPVHGAGRSAPPGRRLWKTGPSASISTTPSPARSSREPFGARVVPADERGAPLGEPVALSTAPGALETPVEAAAGERAAFTAFVQFPDRDDEDRFDFIFLSDEEKAALTAETAPTELPELRVPDTPQAILDAIRARDRRVQALIDQGRWADLFIPAHWRRRILALAYGEAASDRPWVALKRIVRGAWLLDLYGDQGDRVRVGEAYEIFAEGMRGLPEQAPE